MFRIKLSWLYLNSELLMCVFSSTLLSFMPHEHWQCGFTLVSLIFFQANTTHSIILLLGVFDRIRRFNGKFSDHNIRLTSPPQIVLSVLTETSKEWSHPVTPPGLTIKFAFVLVMTWTSQPPLAQQCLQFSINRKMHPNFRYVKMWKIWFFKLMKCGIKITEVSGRGQARQMGMACFMWNKID